jgi:putative endopeptidase
MKATPIPADKASYGIFTILADDTRKRLLDLIQESAKAGAGGGQRCPQSRRFLFELHG